MRAAELIYFPGCPHVAEARAQLGRAFIEVNLRPAWIEYRTDDPHLPDYARGFGSPTILVNGQDVMGAAPEGCSEACRLYVDETGTHVGVPPLQRIVAALTEAQRA